MLKPDQPVAIFMEATLGLSDGKMGYGILRYSPNPLVCVVDSTKAGKRVSDFVDMPRDCPVVATIEEAHAIGAEVLVLGIAPPGGRIPDNWMNSLESAVAAGISIVNGLHNQLNTQFPDLPSTKQWIWDVRQPGKDPAPNQADAATLNNKRVLFIGTDMAIGKMTAGLEIYRWLRERNPSTAFLATGQIGITITGRGIPLDAYKLDHACNAVSELVLGAADSEIVLIEGQGSLLHPRSCAPLALIRGTCPTHFVLCHRAGMDFMDQFPAIRVPPLNELIDLAESLASACGSYTRPETIGIALRTDHLSDAEARAAIDKLETETGLPVIDPVRFGAETLGRPLL